MTPPTAVPFIALVVDHFSALFHSSMDFPVYHHGIFCVKFFTTLVASNQTKSYRNMAKETAILKLTFVYISARFECSMNI
jgi:hypothetical protein